MNAVGTTSSNSVVLVAEDDPAMCRSPAVDGEVCEFVSGTTAVRSALVG